MKTALKTMEFRRGDVIFRAGDAGACMYDVRKGKVGIFTDYGTEYQEKLTELGEGAFFGEMGMLDNSPRSADAVALSDGTAIGVIGEDDLGALFAEDPGRVLAMLKNMTSRLRDLTVDYLTACQTVKSLSEAEAGELPDELRERVERYAGVK
jgi:CRP-like cAMP-binding protein